MIAFGIIWGLFASVFLSGLLAREKGRSTVAWVIAALFFGPLALLAIAGLPRIKGG